MQTIENDYQSRIKKISIRGRVALGIRCIEIYAGNLGVIGNPVIKELLNRLWEYTDSNRLDDWHNMILEYDPECIIDDVERKSLEDLEHVSEEYFLAQYKVYKGLPVGFNSLVSWVIEIGLSNLYGGVGKYSKPSYQATVEAIAIFKKDGNILPDLSLFEKSGFDESGGWGLNRDRSFFITDGNSKLNDGT